ncbi:MAG: TetR/AcrR family transcriptional regulator [Alcanivoracaceae bacterium]|nr:TetR/AcrR family transcriptional regulator [Alcanivoracaceae bacterium]
MSTSKRQSSQSITSTPDSEALASAGYHHGNLRAALIDEGLVLLEQTGEAKFSLRELARRVGVTANAAYRHFANKDALLMGLAAEGMRLFAASQAQAWAATSGDDADKFLSMGSNYVRFAQGRPELFRLMFGRYTVEHRSDELEQASNFAFAGLTQGVAAALGLSVESEETQLAAYNAWAVVHGFSHLILDGQIAGNGQDANVIVEAALKQWLVTTKQTL